MSSTNNWRNSSKRASSDWKESLPVRQSAKEKKRDDEEWPRGKGRSERPRTKRDERGSERSQTRPTERDPREKKKDMPLLSSPIILDKTTRPSKVFIIWDYKRCPVLRRLNRQYTINKLIEFAKSFQKPFSFEMFSSPDIADIVVKMKFPEPYTLHMMNTRDKDIDAFIGKFFTQQSFMTDDVFIVLTSLQNEGTVLLVEEMKKRSKNIAIITNDQQIKKRQDMRVIRWSTFLDYDKMLREKVFDTRFVDTFVRVCGFLTLYGKCTKSSCNDEHVCLECLSPDHGKFTCPLYQLKRHVREQAQKYHYPIKLIDMSPDMFVRRPTTEKICEGYNSQVCPIGLYCPDVHKCNVCGQNDLGMRYCTKCRTELPRCKNGTFCYKGILCDHYHTPLEFETMKKNKGRGIVKARTEMCKNFMEGKCNDKACLFAHDPKDAICYLCLGEGHFADKCTCGQIESPKLSYAGVVQKPPTTVLSPTHSSDEEKKEKPTIKEKDEPIVDKEKEKPVIKEENETIIEVDARREPSKDQYETRKQQFWEDLSDKPINNRSMSAPTPFTFPHGQTRNYVAPFFSFPGWLEASRGAPWI